MNRAKGVKSARVVQALVSKVSRRLGTEKDPVRDVTQYWDLEGNFLAEMDCEPQYLSELSIWENERLSKIIEDLKEEQTPQRN